MNNICPVCIESLKQNTVVEKLPVTLCPCDTIETIDPSVKIVETKTKTKTKTTYCYLNYMELIVTRKQCPPISQPCKESIVIK